MFAQMTQALDFQAKALVLRADRQRIIASPTLPTPTRPGYAARDINFKAALAAATGQNETGAASTPATGASMPADASHPAIWLQPTSSLSDRSLDYAPLPNRRWTTTAWTWTVSVPPLSTTPCATKRPAFHQRSGQDDLERHSRPITPAPIAAGNPIMSMFSIFNVSGSAISAQSQRPQRGGKQLANADAVAGPDGQSYRADRSSLKPPPWIPRRPPGCGSARFRRATSLRRVHNPGTLRRMRTVMSHNPTSIRSKKWST